MYIGKTPTVGNFQVCDAISVVNGQAAYTLQVGGVNVAPESANHMLVSLNGILQKPGSSFTISGSTMTFASNLATGDVIDFVQILGNVLDIGQPSDDTVTAAKLNDDIISGQTALTSAPDSTDELLISDAGTLKRIDASLVGRGKVLQVVSMNLQTEQQTTSTSFTSTNLTKSITPSATSSKVLIIAAIANYINTASQDYTGTIYRASSNLATNAFGRERGNGGNGGNATFVYLDSPNTTSETTYTYYHKVSGGTGYLSINDYLSSMTLIEIGA